MKKEKIREKILLNSGTGKRYKTITEIYKDAMSLKNLPGFTALIGVPIKELLMVLTIMMEEEKSQSHDASDKGGAPAAGI